MFDQSLYEQNAADQPLQEGDLFRNYEIRSWVLSPRLYKILSISAIANILAIIVIGQTSLMTMKGCDSPLVNTVCQVLDTVYVGSMLFGTDREYVDQVYEKTDLGDAEITFVDVGGANAPLTYPEGYFQIANPVEFAMLQQQANDPTMNSGFPGIPIGIPMYRPQSGGSLLDTTPNIPKPKQDVVDGDLPGINDSGVGSTSPMNRRKKGSGGKVTIVPDKDENGCIPGIPCTQTANTNTDPNKKVDPTGPVADVEINKRPFVDLATSINELLDKNQVKLETPFLINATGKLDKDGKLDPKTFKFLKAESADPKMIEVVKEAIEAMNESGYLQYLSLLSGKNLSFQIQQDDQTVTAIVQSEFENDLRPKTVSTLLNAYIDQKKKAKESPEADQNDKDDLVLLQNAVATPTGKKIVISFNIPKADLQRMIQRKLAEQKAQPNKQTGNGIIKPNDNSANK